METDFFGPVSTPRTLSSVPTGTWKKLWRLWALPVSNDTSSWRSY